MLKFFKAILPAVLLTFVAPTVFSQESENSRLVIDARFTNPQCQVYENKPKNAYCTRTDLPKAQADANGPFKKIIDLIKTRGLKKITMGTMTFSNKEVAAALCQAIKSRVEVDLILDAGAEMATADTAVKCGAKLYKIGTAEPEDENGNSQRGDLHHNKFLLVESDQSATLAFSSANFSNPGLTINHETWTFVTADAESELMASHQCLIESLKNYTSDLSAFRREVQACRSRLEKDSSSKIESYFVPADSSKLLRYIDEKMKTSSRILLASNRYSYDKITQAFAQSKSRDNRAVFDDDLYWGGIQPTEDYVREALDARKVSQLEKAKTTVRFTQTSFGAAQKMHAKFIVFDDAVVVGAGNFTYAGMTANFENFYVIRDPVTVEKFSKQFEYLWRLSTPRSEMPKDYVDFGTR